MLSKGCNFPSSMIKSNLKAETNYFQGYRAVSMSFSKNTDGYVTVKHIPVWARGGSLNQKRRIVG